VASIVVVGGGIAGLACAFELERAGHRVEVLEREAAAGGRMRSERAGGYVVDRGAQFIASGYRHLHALARDLGLSQQVRPLARARNAVQRGGALHPGDYDEPLRFLRSRLLSWRAKTRLIRLLAEFVRRRRQLDPWHPERAARFDREDLAQLLRRTVGDEALEYLFQPAFSSTFDCEPEDLSGAFGLLALRLVAGGFRLQSFEGGTGRLTEALAGRLQVRVACEVRCVETTPGGVRVRLRGGAGGAGAEQTLEADAAVLAVPGSAVAALCPTLSATERAFFAEVRYVRGIVAFLLLERAPATLPYYGVAFPRREGVGLYGLAVDHWKAGVCPPGAGLVNVALRAREAERVWGAPDEEVLAFVQDELARTPVGRLEPARGIVHRWDPMLPLFHAGYTRAIRAFLERPERSPRLAFAGDYLVGPYTEMALTSGLRAARALDAELRG
jgi:protoporphyrinogen/coproporphyrinogen III oxidase